MKNGRNRRYGEQEKLRKTNIWCQPDCAAREISAYRQAKRNADEVILVPHHTVVLLSWVKDLIRDKILKLIMGLSDWEKVDSINRFLLTSSLPWLCISFQGSAAS